MRGVCEFEFARIALYIKRTRQAANLVKTFETRFDVAIHA